MNAHILDELLTHDYSMTREIARETGVPILVVRRRPLSKPAPVPSYVLPSQDHFRKNNEP